MTSNSKQPASRDDIRKKIFAFESRQPDTKVIEFFGTEVEVRQPSLKDLLASQSAKTPEQDRIIQMIIDYTFRPGTDERIFEIADKDSLLAMPYGEDMNRMSRALNELTALATDKAEGNSGKTQRG